MLLDLGKLLSFSLSILSLFALLDSAFFVLATTWEERLILSISRVGLAACVCFGSGLLFHHSTDPEVPLRKTLPVQMFFWTLFGVAVLFAACWYLDAYDVPWLWKSQPH
jgi:hypothetical protein